MRRIGVRVDAAAVVGKDDGAGTRSFIQGIAGGETVVNESGVNRRGRGNYRLLSVDQEAGRITAVLGVAGDISRAGTAAIEATSVGITSCVPS